MAEILEETPLHHKQKRRLKAPFLLLALPEILARPRTAYTRLLPRYLRRLQSIQCIVRQRAYFSCRQHRQTMREMLIGLIIRRYGVRADGIHFRPYLRVRNAVLATIRLAYRKRITSTGSNSRYMAVACRDEYRGRPRSGIDTRNINTRLCLKIGNTIGPGITDRTAMA
jgi:hypothetical protein